MGAKTHWSLLPPERPSSGKSIDEFIEKKLSQKGLRHSIEASKRTLIRRVHLDLLGLLPSPEEVNAFVTDERKDAYEKLIERVLENPSYGERWARHWLDVVRYADSAGFETNHERPNAYHYRDYVIRAFNEDKPYDQFVFEQVAGDTLGEDAATGFLVAGPKDIVGGKDPLLRKQQRANELADMVGVTGSAFLGLTVGCARCHDHPFEDLRQDDYYRFAALFDGIDYEIVENKRKDKFDKHQFRGEQKVKLVALDKLDQKIVLKHPRTRKPPEPGLLERGAPPLASMNRRLEEMAQWVISHPNFARVQANRIWFHMTGRALIEPVDDVRDTNPASNPALMETLEHELRDSGYDPRHLIRLIANSRTYQFSADPRGSASGSEENFARATVRRYPAEVIIDAAHRSLAGPIEFADTHKSTRSVGMPGVESVHLSRNPGHGERFLKLFGKPARLTSSDAERNDETTLAQVFELTGGETLNRLLQQDNNRIGRQIRQGNGDAEIVDALYWAILTRAPSANESTAMLQYLSAAGDRRGALEDVAWGLLNAKEFILRR